MKSTATNWNSPGPRGQKGVIGIRVFVEAGKAKISGYYSRRIQRLSNQISCINGLTEFSLDLKLTEELRHEDMEKTQLVNQALAKNKTLPIVSSVPIAATEPFTLREPSVLFFRKHRESCHCLGN